MWIAAIGRDGRATPLRVSLTLAFDRTPDGRSVLFNQAANLFVAPHADGYVMLSAWVEPGAHRINVRATPSADTDMSDVTLRVQCSDEPVPEGAPSTQQPLLDEALKLYFATVARAPSDPARLRALAQSRATGAALPDDVMWALRAMLYEAGDEHSYLVLRSSRGAFFDMLAPTPPRVELRDDGVALVALSQVAFDIEERPHTRFFGKPTLGLYNSGVQQYALSDGTMFGIVHVLNADRTGRVREGALVPDTVVADGADAVAAAAAWVLAQPSVSASSRSAPAPAAAAAPSPD